MTVTRRRVLQSMAMAGLAASATSIVPNFLRAQANGGAPQFPPQSAIDSDPLRPRFHLMPKRGWMNDPCAPVFFNDRYHLFFQYNPGASVWGDMHWAHAVSKDMVHWTHRPVALSPTPGGPDSYGVFTGSMVFDKAIPTILYTCVSPSSKAEATLWNSNPPEREAQCLATPADAVPGDPDAVLDRWNKLPVPVIQAPPSGMKVTGFRDPVPWKGDDGSYYMLLASGQKGVGGNVLLYKSADLRAWTYQGIFAQGRPTGKETSDTVDSGETWECPDFFALGDKHLLIHSAGTSEGRQTLWQSGTLDKSTMRWTPEKAGVLNHGPYYAPKTQVDAAGQRILWGWIPEDRPEAEYARAGWAGCMSLPRVLTLEDGEVRFRPAAEVNSLRGQVSTGAGSVDAANVQVEMVLQIVSSGPEAKGGPLPKPSRVSHGLLTIETSSDATAQNLRFGKQEIALPESMPSRFDVRCFFDHSVIEVFFGELLVLTRRVYDESPTTLMLPGNLNIAGVHVYPLMSI